MPYEVRGSDLYHYKNGHWEVKQHCGSKEKAKAALRLLQGLEHGDKDIGKRTKK